MVERNLAKVEVASSRLVSRSKYKKEATANTALPFFLQVLAQWQSGYAADCKSVYVGSIPACASSIFSPSPPYFPRIWLRIPTRCQSNDCYGDAVFN